MSEEQAMGTNSQEAPQQEEKAGGSKATVIVVVVIIIIAAAAVYAQQNGFGGETAEEQGEVMEKEQATGEGSEEGEVMEKDGQVMEDTDGEVMENKEGDGTVIDDGAGFEVDAPEGQAQAFTVTGKNFEFSTKEIRVKKGDTVTINFASTEGFHDWKVDEFDARTERVNAGESSAVIFVADTTGTFEYYCSVGSHRQLGMVGTLIVE